MSEDQETYTYIPRIHHEPEPEPMIVADIERLQDELSSVARSCATLQLKLAALEKGQDELSESVHDLMAATAPEPQGDVLERIAVAVESIDGNVFDLLERAGRP